MNEPEQHLTMAEINQLNLTLNTDEIILIYIHKIERTETKTLVHCEIEHNNRPYVGVFHITKESAILEQSISKSCPIK